MPLQVKAVGDLAGEVEGQMRMPLTYGIRFLKDTAMSTGAAAETAESECVFMLKSNAFLGSMGELAYVTSSEAMKQFAPWVDAVSIATYALKSIEFSPAAV